MKTGIIVYSQTGHTMQAAQKLLDTLRNNGQDGDLQEVKVSNLQPEMNVSRVQLTNKPTVDAYDKLVFASPVWDFSLSGVMKAYLVGLPSLNGKNVYLFVTYQLPFAWMGGNKAIGQMKTICEEKGGDVVSHAVICWSEKRREHDIAEMLKKLA